MSKRCRTCCHWDTVGSEKNWGRCAMADSDSGNPTTQKTRAYALDYECYAAGLETKASFGCVQHKPTTSGKNTE